METEFGVYIITNLINGKFYIGSSIHLSDRKNTHFRELEQGIHDNNHLQKAYNKYGKDNFTFKIIEYIECRENVIPREQYWIDYFLSATKRENLYNICLIAGSCAGVKRSEESKKLYSLAKMGDKNPMKRADVRAKKSASSKGYVTPEFVKEKIRVSNSGEKNHNFGKFGKESACYGSRRTKKVKNILSNMAKKRWQRPEYVSKRKEISLKKRIDMIGKRFERLTVIAFSGIKRIGKNNKLVLLYECRCDCGNICIVYGSKLRSGWTKSCGCLQKEMQKINGQKLNEYNMSQLKSQEIVYNRSESLPAL